MAENKRNVVLDASVLLKFILDEKEDREQAYELKRSIGLGEIVPYIPSFCFYEISNILSRSPAFENTKKAFEAYEALHLYSCIEIPLNDVLVQHTFRLIKSAPKISFYDAIYHVIAMYQDAPYITADKKYYDLMKHHGHVKLLGDWKV